MLVVWARETHCHLSIAIGTYLTMTPRMGSIKLASQEICWSFILTARRIFLSYLPPLNLDPKFGEIQTKYSG